MPLSVFNPSLCCLLPFHLVLCRCFKAMSLVGINFYPNRASSVCIFLCLPCLNCAHFGVV